MGQQEEEETQQEVPAVNPPLSSALRMATSMSWWSSELRWKTVICRERADRQLGDRQLGEFSKEI